jgi:5-methyltetrahydrofolate--homocysteine methyltransferase
MSGLLVKSTLIMRENLEIMNERAMSNVPVLLGGAALTRTYVERDLREVYSGRLFYGKDAFEGLRVLDQLGDIRRGGTDDPTFGRELSTKKVQRRFREEKLAGTEVITRSTEVEEDNPLFVPPFLGSRVAKGMSLDEITEFLNQTALFRNQWGFRPEDGEDDNSFKERVSATLREQLSLAKEDDLLVPQVVWGHYPAASDGNDLVIFRDDTHDKEITRFHFPRQADAPNLCIADFFRPVASPDRDYASFMLVTMGNRVSERAHQLFSENRYTDYLMLHGLGVEMAEALAEMWHKRIRAELGFVDEDGPTLTGLFRQKYRGGRYSWGYPACPDLTDNAKVAALLESERIGVSVSEGFQLHPEQTTDAIICHHPKAKYFIA